jgi:hypothetical protein
MYRSGHATTFNPPFRDGRDKMVFLCRLVGTQEYQYPLMKTSNA